MSTHIFEPSRSWESAFYKKDCPLARVHVTISGASATEVTKALRAFASELREGTPEPHTYDQVFFSGGWSLGVRWRNKDYPDITLESAGEDGMSSLGWASEYLVQALEKHCPTAVLSYQELPF